MTQSLTSPELMKLRGDSQWSRYYLAIQPRPIVFAALINQSFSTFDEVVSLTFDTVTIGAYTDIKPDMTVYIGSSAGANDVGICRVRKSATSTKIPIGLVSDIAFADNLFITVVNHYDWWVKHPSRTGDGSQYMDYDISYDDQHTHMKPVINLGDTAIVWLTGADITINFDASKSWSPSGSAMTYAWTFMGSTSHSGETTTTPTATYDNGGIYQGLLEISSDGNTYSRYFWIYIFSDDFMPVTQFELISLGGSQSEGGWSCGLVFYDESLIADLPDGAEIILFARDFYQGVEGSIGSEIIVFRGWLDEETLESDPNGGSVKIKAYGPQRILNLLENHAVSFLYGDEDWSHFSPLTVDKALWHLLIWRSTANNLIDLYLTGDTREITAFNIAQGTLWSQLNFVADKIFAINACNAQGNLYSEINIQLVASGSRSSFPEVFTLAKNDWRDNLEIIRKFPTVSQVLITGLLSSSGVDATLYSLASGHSLQRKGGLYQKDLIVTGSQSDLNEITGLIMGWQNRRFDFAIPAAGNNRAVDIAPRQYILLAIAAGDTPRGISYSGRAIVRSISCNNLAGTWFPTWDAEPETFAAIGITGDFPGEADLPPDPGNPPVDPWVPPYEPPIMPPVLPPGVTPTYTSKGITWSIGSPAIGGIAGCYIKALTQITQINAFCVGSGSTVAFNVEDRTSPNTPGTNLISAEVTAIESGVEILAAGLAVTSIAAGHYLWLDISDVSGSASQLGVTLSS